jgi:hypothetical protein
MEVNERLEQESPLEMVSAAEAVPVPNAIATVADGAAEAPADAATGPAPGPAWLRLAYSFEFLIAVIAVLMLWSQVGGQGHMDLLPWYTKLACVLSMAWFCVRFTAGIIEQPKAWNRHSAIWFGGILVLALIMGGIVYYYHLHEVPEDSDTEDSTAALVSFPSWHDQTHG